MTLSRSDNVHPQDRRCAADWPMDWYGMQLSATLTERELDNIVPNDIIVLPGPWDHISQKEGRERARSAWWNVLIVDPTMSPDTTLTATVNVSYMVLLVTGQSLFGGLPYGVRQDSRLTDVSDKSRVLTVVPLQRYCMKRVSDAMIPPLFVLPLGVETIPGGVWTDTNMGVALSRRHLGGWRKLLV